MADKKQNPLKYGEIISKCWEDEAYKKRFIEDPESVMAEVGYVTEEGITYKVIEQPKLVKYVVIPYESAKETVQFISKALLNAAEQKDVLIPEGAELRIIQNTEDIHYMILPASPKTLTQTELKMVAGGDSVAAVSNAVAAENAAVAADVAIVACEAQTVVSTNAIAAEAEVVEGVLVGLVVVLI